MSTNNSTSRSGSQGKRDFHEDILDKCTDRLLKKIDLLGTHLFESLQKEGVIGHTQLSRIRQIHLANDQQVSALLSHLRKRNESDFAKFVTCLNKNHHEHVVKILEEEGYPTQNTLPESTADHVIFLVLTEFDKNTKEEISISEQSIIDDLCRIPNTSIYCTRWRPSHDPVCNERKGNLKWLGFDQALWEHYGGDHGVIVPTEIVHLSKIQELANVSHIVGFLPTTNVAAYFFKKMLFPNAEIHTFVSRSIDECEKYFGVTAALQGNKLESTKRLLVKQCEAAISVHPLGYTLFKDYSKVFKESEKVSVYVPYCSAAIARKAMRDPKKDIEKVLLISNQITDSNVVQECMNELKRSKKIDLTLTIMSTKDDFASLSEEEGVLWITTIHSTNAYKQYYPVFNGQSVLLSSDSELVRLIRMARDDDKYKDLIWERGEKEDFDRRTLHDGLSRWFSKEETSNDLDNLGRSLILEFYFNSRILMTHRDFLKHCTATATLSVSLLGKEDGENTVWDESKVRNFLQQLLPHYFRHDSETKELLPPRERTLFENRDKQILQRLKNIMPQVLSVSEGSLIFEYVCVCKGDYEVLYNNTESMKLPSVLSQCFMLFGSEMSHLPSLSTAVMECFLQPPHKEIGKELKIRFYTDGEYEDKFRGIHRAAECGATDMVAEYARSVDNINLRSENGETPLMIASGEGHVVVTETLLNHKADPNLVNEDGVTALMFASRNGHADVVKLLLEYRADPNVAAKEGETALMFASMKGLEEVVEILLKYGADPNVANKSGGTALGVAEKMRHREVVEVLLKHRADPEMADKGRSVKTESTQSHDTGDIVQEEID